jgi:hypothetical protein
MVGPLGQRDSSPAYNFLRPSHGVCNRRYRPGKGQAGRAGQPGNRYLDSERLEGSFAASSVGTDGAVASAGAVDG